EPQVAGFVVRNAIAEPSNVHSLMSLAAYFERNRISAIEGIDTRALTRKIRAEGAMRAMIPTPGGRHRDDVVAEPSTAPLLHRRRPRGGHVCARQHPPARRQGPRLRHLPRPPAPRPGPRWPDV